MISPAVFIPLAEKTELIHQLGIWSLENACYQLHTWQQQFPTARCLTMSVNLSSVQLLQPNLAQQIKRILQQVAIVPGSLKLEIKETVLMQNCEKAIPILAHLQAMGIQVYMDDFGVSYSALGQLQNLPVDVLKIDRSLIISKQWDISKAVLNIAEKLGLDTIVEGVETPEEAARLKALGYKHMQGYFFSKPVNSETASALISTALTEYSHC